MANDQTMAENDNDGVDGDSLSLLDTVEAMLRVERTLTVAIDRSEPWLEGAPVHSHRRRVRPVPQSMEQVQQVLAYARALSNRTSAPPGWNPNAPVAGFSTPNPLPHQLRGGALAALQLERARQRQMKRSRNLQKKERSEREAESSKKKEDQTAKRSADDDDEDGAASGTASGRDPKRRDVAAHQQQQQQDGAGPPPPTTATTAAAARPAATLQDVSMNLSSDESSSDDDED